MDVYLIPTGADQYQPYCEPQDDAPPVEPDAHRGVFKRLSARFKLMLAEAEIERRRAARGESRPLAETWLGRWRDRVMQRVAEHIAEKRLLWHLRRQTEATLHHPDDVSPERALAVTLDTLRREADRHLVWLVINSVLFIGSGALAILPGPNLIAYFLGFFVVAHYLSWRGARHGRYQVTWRPAANEALSELRGALHLGEAARATRVRDIAARLHLEDLPLFLQRIVPQRA
jgi:hypothetical protein